MSPPGTGRDKCSKWHSSATSGSVSEVTASAEAQAMGTYMPDICASSAQNGLGHLLFTFNPIQAQPLDIKTSWNSSHISGFWSILTLTLPASELNHNVCLLVFNWAPSRIISFLQSTGSLMMYYYSWLWHMPTKDKGTFPLKNGTSDTSPKENPQVEPTKLMHQDSTHSECVQATAPTTVKRTLAVAVFTEPLWHVNLHARPLKPCNIWTWAMRPICWSQLSAWTRHAGVRSMPVLSSAGTWPSYGKSRS